MAVPFRSSQLPAVANTDTARTGTPNLAACGAAALVAVALIAFIWIVTTGEVREQQIETRYRAEQALSAEAAAIAETISHELLMIDQSLTIIQTAWQADSDSVVLEKWQKQMPALTEVSDDLFICDEKHIIQQDILPNAVGQGVGAAYVTFPHGSLEHFVGDGSTDKEALMLQGDNSAPIEVRQFLIYVVRPLDHPKDWLVGASYRSAELSKLFTPAAPGASSLVALVDTRRGILQAVVGPAAHQPKTSLSQSPLLGIIKRSAAGTWIGATAIDGVERLHAFHQVGNRDLAVLIAANMTEVMAPADDLVAGARSLAFVATALVLLIAGTVLWAFSMARHHLRQTRTLSRNKSELERLRSEDAKATRSAQLNAARLRVLLDNTADGIALFDSGLRLVQWNYQFRRGIGIEPRQDMPIDTLLREQAVKGLFGPQPDIEAEIGRRTGILRTGDQTCVSQPGPDQENLILRGQPIEDGGFILFLNGLATWELPPPAGPAEVEEPAASVSAPIEW